MMFIIQRKSEGKPNMQFRMNESGLHYSYLGDQELNCFNTVSKNKEGFTVGKIKGEEVARALYITLIYNSAKDYKWVIFSK